MNKLVRISSILIYLFFSQVSPIVHWHVQDCSDSLKLHLSAHPLDFLAEPNEHDHNHHSPEEKSTDDTQFLEAWHFSAQSKIVNQKFAETNGTQITSLEDDFKPFSLFIVQKPKYYSGKWHRLAPPNRAPPFLS